MLKNILFRNKLNLLVAFVLLVVLVFIRFFENKLFYDPFISFFKREYHNQPIPEINSFKLFLSFFCRYLLNSILSIAIIYLIFLKKDLVKFLVIIYSVFFLILVLGFFITLYVYFIDWQVVFYIRRFIIQPLFLILFIPAFLFQGVTKHK